MNGTRNRDRAFDSSASPAAGRTDASLPLPRHLLVSLAGIAADVSSLRQRFVDDPQLQDPLDRILGRLDGLVDSIYDRAADSGAPLPHRVGALPPSPRITPRT